jgi:hypothetical protein
LGSRSGGRGGQFNTSIDLEIYAALEGLCLTGIDAGLPEVDLFQAGDLGEGVKNAVADLGAV